MPYTQDQIKEILKKNPNKKRIEKGRRMADKLMLHVHGVGMERAIERAEYFENKDLYEVRKKYAISNKDLFSRLLQQEDMVFTAKGGSTSFNLSEENEKRMNSTLDDVRYGMSLRKWIQNFALQAYRVDPMGVFFIEVETVDPSATQIKTPKAYPTYKSINSIYDYEAVGRFLKYVCFRLDAAQAKQFGVPADSLKDYQGDAKTCFYRFVDDQQDTIFKFDNDQLEIVGKPLIHSWNRTPAIIVSNIMKFDDPQCFLSPLENTVELADCFLYDRSVRDLQKRYHGFSKAIEPLLTCGTCQGTGFVAAAGCPDCTVPGGDRGTGFKMKTKVSDVARFPLDMAQHGFDWRNFFGYATPDVDGWEKQDMSLSDLESLIEFTYWGTMQPKQVTGVKKSQSLQETATKTVADLQPKYARLNMTAEWGEKTESALADFIGQFWFQESFQKSNIAYGRYYVLETPEELMRQYQDMRTKGAPEGMLFEALEKYYHSVYQNSPMELAIRLKLLYIEPFPHMKASEVKGLATDLLDFNCKLYFGEWYSQLSDIEIVVTKTDALRDKLRAYVKAKNLPEPAPEKPAFQ